MCIRDREAAFRDRGEELLKRMIADLEEVGKVEQDIKLSLIHILTVFPGAAMVLFVLAWNLVGDALRDAFDPRLRL